MSDIFATLAAGPPRPSGTGSGETAVRVVDPSPEFSRLTSGESLRGTVVGKDGHGHLLVRTQLGVLHLAAHRNLPPGTEVVLQVRSIGPQVLLNLLPLDSAAGQAALGAGQSAAPPAPAAPGAAAPLPATPHDLVQRGQVIRAVLHAAPPVPLLAGLPSAAPGADLLVQVISLGVRTPLPGQPLAAGAAGQPAPAQPPTAGPAAPAPGLPAAAVPGTATGQASTPGGVAPQTQSQAQVQASAQAQVPAQAQAPVPTGAAPAAPPSGLAGHGPAALTGSAPSGTATQEAPGLRLAPQIPVTNSGHSLAAALQTVSAEAAARAAGSLPSQPATTLTGSGAEPATATAAQALRLTGLVTGATSSGQPILHTALGTLTLDVKTALPPGSSLALQVALPPAPEGGAAPFMATGWPSLEALEETLFQGLPAQQMEAVARALPQAGPRLASGVLFFLSALNQGNPLAWLAPAAAAAAERDGAGEIFERLGREFVALNRSIETAAGEWRFVNLPVWSDQGLRELRCFFRHQDQGGKGNGDGEKATRFVLELELQRHGELQLDGLVRARRFDLMLRSRRPLPALVRGDLMALFEEANAIAGYSGQLVFQASKDWLQLLSARTEGARQEGVRI